MIDIGNVYLSSKFSHRSLSRELRNVRAERIVISKSFDKTYTAEILKSVALKGT